MMNTYDITSVLTGQASQHLINDAELNWQLEGIYQHLSVAQEFNKRYDGKRLRDRRTKGGRYLARKKLEYISLKVAEALEIKQLPLVFGQPVR